MSKAHFLAQYGSVDNIDAAQKSDDVYMRAAAISNHLVTQNHLNNALNDPDTLVVGRSMDSHACTSNHIEKGLSHTDDGVIEDTIKYAPNITKQQLEKVVDYKSSFKSAHKHLAMDRLDKGNHK